MLLWKINCEPLSAARPRSMTAVTARIGTTPRTRILKIDFILKLLWLVETRNTLTTEQIGLTPSLMRRAPSPRP